MKDHYDDKLADKFRQELEGYEVAFDPADWKAMQQRLPGQDKIRRRVALIIGGVSLVAASLLLGIYIVPTMDLPADQQTAHTQTPVQEANGANQTTASTGASATAPITPSTEKTQVATPSADPSTAVLPGRDAVASATSDNAAASSDNMKVGKSTAASISGSTKGKTRQRFDRNSPAIASVTKRSDHPGNGSNGDAMSTVAGGNNAAGTETKASLPAEQELKQADMALLTPLLPALETTGKVEKLELKAQVQPAKLEGVVAMCPSPKFKLGLAVLPAIDVVTYHKKVIEIISTAPGVEEQYNKRSPVNIGVLNLGIGMMGELQLKKKWSIGAGVILSKQHLTFDEDAMLYVDEKPTDLSRDPNQVTGSEKFLREMSRMSINVPIQVRYNLIENCKNQAFVSAGVSNFVYVKEDYVYKEEMKFIPIDFLPIESTKVGPGSYTSMQFASAVNISAGFERKLGRKLSLQAEPFMRLPLQRSGREKLNVFTGGLMFRLNYNFM